MSTNKPKQSKESKKKNVNFMTANLDDLDSSEDDDYVPDNKAMQQTNKEINKQNGLKEDVPVKSGIEQLRENKK